MDPENQILWAQKDDTQFFGPGETLSNEVVDFETNPDKKDAGDDEDGMPVPTSKPKRKESPEVKVKKLDKLADAEVMGTDLDKMVCGRSRFDFELGCFWKRKRTIVF